MPHDHPTIIANFKKEEQQKQSRINAYDYDRKSNYAETHRATKWATSAHATPFSPAASALARTTALERILGEFDAFAQRNRALYPRVVSVVISSERWTVPLDVAHAFDVGAMRKELHRLFRGLHFFGVIEPGFYPRMIGPNSSSKGAVSWHAHLLFWHGTCENLDRAIARFNERNVGPLFNVAPASIRRRSWKSAAGRIAYMLKTPARSYSLRRMRDAPDQLMIGNDREHDRQYGQRLRPGQLVMMRNVLRDYRLDELFLAGGTGKDLIAPMLRQLLADRKAFEDRINGRCASPSLASGRK